MENVGKKKLDMQKLLAPAALVILYIVFSIFGNNFLTLDTVKNILESSYYIGFMAFGVTFIIITGGIDLSVGAVMAIAGATAASMTVAGHSLPVVLLAALAAGALAGLWNGILVAVLKIQPFVATLILMVAGRGVAQLITAGQIVTFDSPALAWLGSGSFLLFPTPVIVAAATLLLWLGYFFTLLVVYMLINWLPMLLVGQGFRASQAAGVMFSLQIGAACGTLLLGALMDKLTPLRMSLLIYSGILASLLALGSASSLTGMLLAGFVAGLFATGGQSVLYALAPLFYPAAIRATGVGTAVAVGRLGAMSGPLLAGKMLALGTGTGTVGVMAASAPGIVLAGVAVFWLMHRQQRAAMV